MGCRGCEKKNGEKIVTLSELTGADLVDEGFSIYIYTIIPFTQFNVMTSQQKNLIYRVQRDIPMPLVTSGVEHGNLRELALARMQDLGTKCRDVRTREVGIQELHHKIHPYEVELIRRDYAANGGWETFLSYEDPEQDILIGLLRLRKCSDDSSRPEIKNKGVSIVRELHVYGSVVPLSCRDPRKFQHQGFGTLLMEEAERIARDEHGAIKLLVISGVGTRNYYRKLGYELEGPYMYKTL